MAYLELNLAPTDYNKRKIIEKEDKREFCMGNQAIKNGPGRAKLLSGSNPKQHTTLCHKLCGIQPSLTSRQMKIISTFFF